jgi:transposase-like protein
VVAVAVDWLTIRNDYISGGGSYRKLAEKYGVSFSVLKDKAVSEKWKDAKDAHKLKIRTKVEQKLVDVAVKQELSRAVRLLTISDELITKIEQAVSELDMVQVTNKKKTKVIEYNNYERPDKPTKEIIDEQEEILSVQSIIDRKGLQLVATALKAVWDMTAGENDSTDENDDGFLDALNGTAEEDWSDESDIPI